MPIPRPLAALLVALLAVDLCDVGAGTLGVNAAAAGEKERLLNELDLMEDDGSIETALINYLFAKQVVDRLRKELDVTDLQRKRTYWKQCAFNAVSCFGK